MNWVLVLTFFTGVFVGVLLFVWVFCEEENASKKDK